jgi:hypothetical protein
MFDLIGSGPPRAVSCLKFTGDVLSFVWWDEVKIALQ